MKEIQIFGTRVHNIATQEAFHFIQSSFQDGKKLFITTPNPEILLEAKEKNNFRNILNTANLAIPDGFGLRIVPGISKRGTGVDLTVLLLQWANEKKLKITIILRKDGLSKKNQVKTALKKIAPNTILTIIEHKKETPKKDAQIKTLESQPDILLVGLGFPEQEYFAQSITAQSTNPIISIGIGATLDFMTGAQKRAPKFFQYLGLEWFWRLLTQPHRWKRIFRATILFPLIYILSKKKD